MSAWLDAQLAVADDPNFGTTGLYTPLTGAAVTVKVIRGGNRVSSFSVGDGEGGGAQTNPFSIFQSEVPVRPARGSTIVIDGTAYTIESADPGGRGVLWRLDVG